MLSERQDSNIIRQFVPSITGSSAFMQYRNVGFSKFDPGKIKKGQPMRRRADDAGTSEMSMPFALGLPLRDEPKADDILTHRKPLSIFYRRGFYGRGSDSWLRRREYFRYRHHYQQGSTKVPALHGLPLITGRNPIFSDGEDETTRDVQRKLYIYREDNAQRTSTWRV